MERCTETKERQKWTGEIDNGKGKDTEFKKK